ncbi:MAG TPA: hypothetical protein DCZ10_15920 [Pelotomaculum sp.]|nr:hypothetical protein [Pelotomaculum sp.]
MWLDFYSIDFAEIEQIMSSIFQPRRKPYDSRIGMQPIVPRGTVLVGRRHRPNQRDGVPYGRQRKRGSEIKEAG